MCHFMGYLGMCLPACQRMYAYDMFVAFILFIPFNYIAGE